MRKAWGTLLVACVLAQPAAEAFAEGDVPPGQPPPEQAAATPHHSAVEEIIVTAQKREESLQEVPISLSVVNTELIHDLNITDFHDLALYVPNVSVNNTSGTFNDV